MCGVWRLFERKEWKLIVDEEKRGRLLSLQSSTSLAELRVMVLEEYGIEDIMVDVEFSYLPKDLSVEFPPVVMVNDRQVENFLACLKKKNTIPLCVTFKDRVDDCRSGDNFDLNKEPCESSDGDDDAKVPQKSADGDDVTQGRHDSSDVEDDGKVAHESVELVDNTKYKSSKSVDGVVHTVVDSMVVKGHYFPSKEALQATMEMHAMRYNCDYRVTKSDKMYWCIRCIDSVCKWSLRAKCLEGSNFFIVKKYLRNHTCAPSKKSKFCRTPSSRTIGHLIMHNYEGMKEGPKPNDIINTIRSKYGCELTYSQAWESREYAINEVRGIPEKSYGKIPKYLFMLQEANPGTYSNFETDCNGRFKYLFISFGPSIRGFQKTIRKVLVVDGTFLKSKYKGVLLVATALDGNSNLYPIAFGVADSENDCAWEWFLRQLHIVVPDDEGLAFVSDRHLSIGKSIRKMYPLARHGICIHHLIGNVITYYKGKGVAGLVAKASKANRVAEFEDLFMKICNISPAIGGYLEEADVTAWARCHFPGYRYDVNTNNPAESINSALRSPREFPIIPLLDSIREMLTRWFYEHRELSEKHKYPLTVRVENKISRRIEKCQFFKVYPISKYVLQVKVDRFEYVVDLERRTCSCGKFQMQKIPCRHAIKAAFHIGHDIYPYADDLYTTTTWRSLYEETINPIGICEEEWRVPEHVKDAKVLPPETRRRPGRQKKRRHETVEDKIRSSQGTQGSKRHKCSRCNNEGHNRTTCEIAI